MSEQRKHRKELRQGLHQFLMQMYMSYLESHSESDAKEIVKEVMVEQFKYFSADDIAVDQTKKTLSIKVQELTDKMNGMTDYDAQLYYAEKIDALNEAIGILDTKIAE